MRTNWFKEEDVVWVDINKNKFTLAQIDDRYLLNILNFIKKGGGYVNYMNDERITKLYKEAKRRKLKFDFKLKELIDAYHEKLNMKIVGQIILLGDEEFCG